MDTVKAHEGKVWSLQVQPDGKGLVSGSSDKSAIFWNFEIVQEEIPGTKVSFITDLCNLIII